MSQATYGVDIVADDKTEKGSKAAEKRLSLIPKRASAVNKRFSDEADRSIARSSRSILRTFGNVEQASARVFGGGSITSGLGNRLGAVKNAASALGSGLGEASVAGGALEGAMAGVGVAAGATIGVLAAAAYGAVKFAGSWAAGAAQISRTAEIMGVATQQLQEFTAAAERVGVDKGTSAGALGGLNQTLNDARYGRNNEAVAALARMGVKMQLNADGTVNTGAMLPAIANAIQRQNSSGRRTAARLLGIPEAALPAFSQGGKALSADMKDADSTAYIQSDADSAKARRIARKGAIVSQMTDRKLSVGGSLAAGFAEHGYDLFIDAGRGFTSGATAFGGAVKTSFAPAAEKISHAADEMLSAARRTVSEIGHGIIGAAQAAERNWGIPASISLAQYALESGNGRHVPAGSNNPFGIKARSGDPFVTARTREEDRSGRSYWVNARFRKFGSIEEAFDEHAHLLDGNRYRTARRSLPNVGLFADALTGVYATDHRYGSKLKDVIRQEGLSRYDQGSEIPVRVEVHLVNAPPGTRSKVTAGRGTRPAISHAMQH